MSCYFEAVFDTSIVITLYIACCVTVYLHCHYLTHVTTVSPIVTLYGDLEGY